MGQACSKSSEASTDGALVPPTTAEGLLVEHDPSTETLEEVQAAATETEEVQVPSGETADDEVDPTKKEEEDVVASTDEEDDEPSPTKTEEDEVASILKEEIIPTPEPLRPLKEKVTLWLGPRVLEVSEDGLAWDTSYHMCNTINEAQKYLVDCKRTPNLKLKFGRVHILYYYFGIDFDPDARDGLLADNFLWTLIDGIHTIYICGLKADDRSMAQVLGHVRYPSRIKTIHLENLTFDPVHTFATMKRFPKLEDLDIANHHPHRVWSKEAVDNLADAVLSMDNLKELSLRSWCVEESPSEVFENLCCAAIVNRSVGSRPDIQIEEEGYRLTTQGEHEPANFLFKDCIIQYQEDILDLEEEKADLAERLEITEQEKAELEQRIADLEQKNDALEREKADTARTLINAVAPLKEMIENLPRQVTEQMMRLPTHNFQHQTPAAQGTGGNEVNMDTQATEISPEAVSQDGSHTDDLPKPDRIEHRF